MSAEEMTVPPGEVHLDGRIYYMDGAWSGIVAAGQIVQGTTGAESPPQLLVPDGTTLGPYDLEGDGIIPYSGPPPKYVGNQPAALCVWYETFMERLMRNVERRGELVA